MSTDTTFAALVTAVIGLITVVVVMFMSLYPSKEPRLCEIEVKSTSVESHVWIKPCMEIKE